MNIAFLGAGNIAQAIIGGLLKNGTPPDSLLAADPSEETRGKVSQLGIRTLATNEEAAANADAIIVCVKPDLVATALSQLAPVKQGNPLFVSVAAGVTIPAITKLLGGYQKVVRCMPNTPALVGEGMTALYATADVDDADRKLAEAILGSVGATLWVAEESQLDAVTAVSGSGPAYFFYLMEAMIKAAEAEGLAPEVARQLVVQTALGSAQVIKALSGEPAELRRSVTSPGGTTAAAINHLEGKGFEKAVIDAIRAASHRSVELSATLTP